MILYNTRRIKEYKRLESKRIKKESLKNKR